MEEEKKLLTEEDFSRVMMKYFGEEFQYPESYRNVAEGIDVDWYPPDEGKAGLVWVQFKSMFDFSDASFLTEIMERIAVATKRFEHQTAQFIQLVKEKGLEEGDWLPDSDEAGYWTTHTIHVYSESDIDKISRIIKQIAEKEVVEISVERRHEIAYILLKHKAKKNEYPRAHLKRDLGNLSKETNISVEELKEFARILDFEVHSELFYNE